MAPQAAAQTKRLSRHTGAGDSRRRFIRHNSFARAGRRKEKLPGLPGRGPPKGGGAFS